MDSLIARILEAKEDLEWWEQYYPEDKDEIDYRKRKLQALRELKEERDKV